MGNLGLSPRNFSKSLKRTRSVDFPEALSSHRSRSPGRIRLLLTAPLSPLSPLQTFLRRFQLQFRGVRGFWILLRRRFFPLAFPQTESTAARHCATKDKTFQTLNETRRLSLSHLRINSVKTARHRRGVTAEPAQLMAWHG